MDAPWLKAFLPELAARLCAQLHGENALPLPAAYREMELVSVNAWHNIMRLICEGVRPPEALRQVGIRPGLFAAHLRYEPRLKAWLARAKQASKRRHQPSVLEMDAVLRALIYNPGVSARTVCRQHGVNYPAFLARTRTPEFESRYLGTKSVQLGRSFEAIRTEAGSEGLTRAARSELARQAHALLRLEPRRTWTRKPLSAAAQRLRDARRRAARGRS